MGQLEYEQSDHHGSRVELYLFETEDGRNKFAYTTDRVARYMLSTTFVPNTIKRGELRQQAGDGSQERLAITLPWDDPVARMHVPYMPPMPVKVTVYSYQRNDPASEIIQAFSGYVSSFAQKGVDATLECSQIVDSLGQIVPWVTFKSGCVWALYHIGCGLDKGLWSAEVTDVSTVDKVKITAGTFSTFPDGWFTNGFLFNPATGEQRFISRHSAAESAVYLTYPLLGYSAGDLIAYAGCDRHRDTCSDKFNNRINYLGFDRNPLYNVFQQGIT